MVSNKEIIAYIAKNNCLVDEAIAALEKEYREKASSQTLVEKCLSDDQEIASDAWVTYVQKEKHDTAVLRKMALEDLEQCTKELEQKMKYKVMKSGMTLEQAEVEVYVQNPMLYQQMQKCYRILNEV